MSLEKETVVVDRSLSLLFVEIDSYSKMLIRVLRKRKRELKMIEKMLKFEKLTMEIDLMRSNLTKMTDPHPPEVPKENSDFDFEQK